MAKIYVTTLGEYLEVSEQGTFRLPDREYSPATLKKIAREINRAIMKSQQKGYFDDE